METRAFSPLYAPTTGLVAGTLLPSTTITPNAATATANAATAPFSGTSQNQFVQILVSNTTTAWAYVNFGIAGAVTAATVAASIPVGPGNARVFTVASEVTGASVILAAASTGGTTVIFTRGEGII